MVPQSRRLVFWYLKWIEDRVAHGQAKACPSPVCLLFKLNTDDLDPALRPASANC